MAFPPVVLRPCSRFSRHWNQPASSSSARRRMDLEFEFVPSQRVANEKSLLPSGRLTGSTAALDKRTDREYV